MDISIWEEKELKNYNDPHTIIIGDIKEKCRELFQINYDSRILKIQINFVFSDIIINGFRIENDIRSIKIDHNSIIVIKSKTKTVKMILEYSRELGLADIENSKQLPFVIPKYSTYPKHTALLAILTAYNKDKAWLYNNFMLMWATIWEETYEYWTDFKYANENIRNDFCPMIKKEEIERGKLNSNNIIKTITEGIHNGKYFLLLLDMYYIDEWWSNDNKNHCTHQSLIYGYNYKKKEFYIADFFNGRYQSILISYETLIKSYCSGLYEKSNMVEKYIVDEVFIYNNVDYSVDLKIIRQQLADFIFSRDTCRYDFLNLYQIGNISYGFTFFITIQKHLNNCIYNDTFLDIRPFQFIKEFNEIMIERIIYIQNMGKFEIEDICEKFKKLYDMSKMIVNYLIKYVICNKKNILHIIKEKFENLITIEKEALLELYNILDRDKTFEYNDIRGMATFEPVIYEYLSYYEKEIELIFENKKELEEKNVKKFMYSDSYMVDVFPLEHERFGKVPSGKKVKKDVKDENIHFYGFDDDNKLIIHSLMEAEMTCYKTETYYTYSYNKENIIKIARYMDKETNELKVGRIWILIFKENKPYIELFYGSNGIRNITVYHFFKNKLVSSNVVRCEKIIDEYKQIEYWKEYYYYREEKIKQIVIDKENRVRTIYPAYGVPALDNYKVKIAIKEIVRIEIKKKVVQNKKTICKICGKWDVYNQKLYIEFVYQEAEKQNVSTHELEIYKDYMADSDSNKIIPNIFRDSIYEILYKEFRQQDFSKLSIIIENDEQTTVENVML